MKIKEETMNITEGKGVCHMNLEKTQEVCNFI